MSKLSINNSDILYYNKHKNKPLKEWLKFDQIFNKSSKQGYVGLMELIHKKPKTKCIFKISQYINYLIPHESIIMKSLNDLSSYCLHFCKYIGTITCNIDPTARKTKNPFNVSKHSIKKEVLLCEYINKSYKLYNYIRAVNKIPENVLYSTIKQVLLAIIIAQRKKQFSHYDLHSNNIMMRRCNRNLVFLYILDENNQFYIPTFGHYPTIIDFGFSYIKDMENKPLWASMGHTNVGFMSDRFDPIADPKLFLVTVSSEIKAKRKSKNSKKLRRIVKNIFHPLKINWESGWDCNNKKGASDYVLKILKKYNTYSKFFKKYDYYCIDIIQSLIILPLEQQNYKNIYKSYISFLKEWSKIEKQIKSPFYCLYILKNITDTARNIRPDYLVSSTRYNAVRYFKNNILKTVDSIAKFCILNINYEKMLCSLLVFAKCIEGILYDTIQSRMNNKVKQYNKLPLKSTEQIFAAIDVNIPSEYKFNENTIVLVMNSILKNKDLLILKKEQINIINKIHSLCRGTVLYDIYTGKSPI